MPSARDILANPPPLNPARDYPLDVRTFPFQTFALYAGVAPAVPATTLDSNPPADPLRIEE